MKLMFAIAAVAACVALGTPRAFAQAAPADLVQQVQAADLLADLMTYTVARADTRLKDAQAFLQKIGKLQAYEEAKPNPPMPKPLNYMLLFRGALAFVEGDGAKYADPAVKDEASSQLYQDLTAAQYYNMHEFLHFNQQRQAFASARAYLESIGEYQHYLESIGGNSSIATPAATQPTPTKPEEVARRMGDMLKFIRETARKQAQAKGISNADFDKQWPEQVRRYRMSVMTQIEGAQSIDGGFGKADASGSLPPPPSTPAPPPLPPHYDTPQPDLGANRVLPPPVESPYSNAEYRARDLSLWNMWDDDPRY